MVNVEDIDNLIDRIRKLNPAIDFSSTNEGEATKWAFSLSLGSDYNFYLTRFPDGDLAISALPANQKHVYFWHMVLEELPSVPNDIKDFSEILMAILLKPTRITQIRGMLFWKFSLEVANNNGWQKIYTHHALKFGFNPPTIRGNQKVYEAFPPKL